MKKRIISLGIIMVILVVGFGITSAAEKSDEVEQLGYFKTEGATLSLEEQSVDFTLTDETATVEYTHPLSAYCFAFAWDGVSDPEKKLESVVLTLTDMKQDDISMKFTFRKLTDEYVSVQYNDEERLYLTNGCTYRENQYPISVKYNEEVKTFTDEKGSFEIPAERCLNGNGFQEFPSKGVNIKITVTGKTGAVFRLRELVGQSFGKKYSVDKLEPIISNMARGMKMRYQSVATLPKVEAFDVWEPNVTLKLTVEDPQGNIVKDEKGVQLSNVDGRKDYKIKFDKLGQYRAIYQASDGTNETRKIRYQIYVNYYGKPEIELKKNLPNTVKIGDEVILPKMKITAVPEGDCSAWICVKHPSGYMTRESKKFVPETQGTYIIIFSAVDAEGNIGQLEKEIYVDGGEQ